MTRFWDGRTDGRSDCTPRPVLPFFKDQRFDLDLWTCDLIIKMGLSVPSKWPRDIGRKHFYKDQQFNLDL